MHWLQFTLALLMIGLCCILMLVILLQRGRGGGLAGAFGGGGGGGGAFGAKTGDVLTWATVVIACLFLLLAVVANFAFDQSAKPVAAAPAAPTSSGQPDASGLPGATTPQGSTELPIKLLPIEGTPVPAPTGASESPADAAPPSAGSTDSGGGKPAVKPGTGHDGASRDNGAAKDDKAAGGTADDGSPMLPDKSTNPGGS